MSNNKSKTKRPTLAKTSPYEQKFQTRYRGPGRPSNGEQMFESAGDVHPLIVQQAQRRAFAVVHEEQRERLGEIYLAELAVLRRRGVEQVASDAQVSEKTLERLSAGSAD